MAFGNGKKARPSLADGLNKNIFVLYMPGSGVLNIIPAMIARRMEELTRRPLIQTIHIFEASSGGGILTGGLNVPGLSAKDGLKLYNYNAQHFLPSIPGRERNLLIKNGINALAHQFGIDPLQANEIKIRNIRTICGMLQQHGCESVYIDTIRDSSVKRWLCANDIRQASYCCRVLAARHPEITKELRALQRNIYGRRVHSTVNCLFRRAALYTVGYINKKIGPNLFLNTDYARSLYEGLFGDRRMSDCLRTTFIYARDVKTGEPVPFYCKKNLLDAPGGETLESSPKNPLLRDAIFASTSHPFGFTPYRTEDGDWFDDWASLHVPFASVEYALSQRPPGFGVKLIILHCGLLTRPHDSIEEIIKNHRETGILGSLMRGELLNHANRYVMGLARLKERLGPENVIEIVPRLYPERYDECEDDFPSHNLLDSSKKNRRRAIRQGRRTVNEYDPILCELAQLQIDTCFATGHMTLDDYIETTLHIGIKDPTEFRKPAISIADRPSRWTALYNAAGRLIWSQTAGSGVADASLKDVPHPH